MRVLLDSDNFCRGMLGDVEHNGSHDELYAMGCSDIEYDAMSWEYAKDHFKQFTMSLVDAHEKRYNSNTSYIAMAGVLGLWNGSPVGGKVMNYDQNPLDCMGKMDRLEVVVGEDNVLTILGYHHDGVNTMNLYIVTDSAIEKLENRGLWDTPAGYIRMVSMRQPVKLPKKNDFY